MTQPLEPFPGRRTNMADELAEGAPVFVSSLDGPKGIAEILEVVRHSADGAISTQFQVRFNDDLRPFESFQDAYVAATEMVA